VVQVFVAKPKQETTKNMLESRVVHLHGRGVFSGDERGVFWWMERSVFWGSSI